MKKQLSTVETAFRLIWAVDRSYPFLLLARNLLSAGFPLYLSYCVSRLVDGLAGAGGGGYMAVVLAAMVAGIFFFKAGGATLEWSCSSRYMKIQDSFIAVNSKKAMEMEYGATEDSRVLDLYSHVWMANLSPGTILEKLFSIIASAAQLAGCIGIILLLEPFLLAAMAVFVSLYHYLDYKARLKEKRCAQETVMDVRGADYARQCMGDADCAKDVRLYYPEDFFPERLRMFQSRRRQKERDREVYCGYMQSLQAVLQLSQTVVLYLVLALRFQNGEIQAGYFSLAVSAVAIFMGAVNSSSRAWNQIRYNEVYLEYLDRFRSLPTRSGEGALWNSGEAVEVAFQNVWFRYPGREEYALEDVSTVVKPGEILTVVGKNGSGKTTFVKLLLGLYRPTRGEIWVNGVNVTKYSDEEYQKAFAPVFQDYQIFAYSIRDNLVFGREYDDQKIQKVLEELRLGRKIEGLPKGLKQCAGKGYEEDGVDFSGGERQKLAIARALLKDSSCLVLDEPTAALDPIAEVELYRKTRRWVENRGCIFITHRLAGVGFSNRVLFFRDGRIAEEGTCEELEEKKGLFYDFYRIQAQFYEE